MNVRSVPLLLLLALLTACYSGQRREMLALLDEADSLNRAYAQMPSDTLLRQAADFFDRHGSRNERVRAHYLLGCAYRDLGQAPEALQCYQDAIDCADTTARDSASLHQLMAVYGQMAELYDLQYLPHDELKIAHEYGRYALLAKDTFCYIRNIELFVKPYDRLGDTTAMLDCLRRARDLYLRYSYDIYAVRTLHTPIYIAVERGELDSARHMMQLYESKSNLFDEQGNIEKGREVYYYFKGLYYLKRDMVDSAELFMRKLLPSGQAVNAYRGLLKIYSKEGVIDSVSKYASLFEEATDKKNNSRETETIKRMSSLYDYQHSERVAYIKSIEAFQMKQLIVVIIFLSLTVISVLLLFYFHVRRQKSKAMSCYLKNVEQLREVRQELIAFKKHEEENKTIISKKEEELASLEKQILDFRLSSSETIIANNPSTIEQTDIYTYFQVLANKGLKPTAEDWEELNEAFKLFLPETFRFINEHVHEMDITSYHVCQLIRIRIKPTPISHMIGVTDAYISFLRKNLLNKIFQVSGKPKDFDSRLLSMN